MCRRHQIDDGFANKGGGGQSGDFKISGVTDADGTVSEVDVYWSPGGAKNSTAGAVELGSATGEGQLDVHRHGAQA